MTQLKILIVDDEIGYRNEISEYLQEKGFSTLKAEKPSVAIELTRTESPDIAIVDLRLPEMSGITLLKKLLIIDDTLAVIMISGHGDMNAVISAMREGAVDFFAKPFNLDDIELSIERTRKYIHLQNDYLLERDTNQRLRKALINEGRHQLIGKSPAIKEVVKLMQQVASKKNIDVLITGESGTGKELIARGIHYLDEQAKGIFYDVNCTAVPDNLFESEFFGHTKNAFTGAGNEKRGNFEIANGGTLFLDEIGDLSLNMQAKLLRVLEERKVRKVGSSKDISLDLRVIVSTNKDIKKMIAENKFREDLYFRLNRFSIHAPALRERREDIPLLINYFSENTAKNMGKEIIVIPPTVNQLLRNYAFKGNVRELRNIVEKAYILHSDEMTELSIDCFPDLSANTVLKLKYDPDSLDLKQLEKLEINLILKALEVSKNNKTKAANLLNITRTSLNRRLKKYCLEDLK